MKVYHFAAGTSLTAICLILAACGSSNMDSTPDPTPTPTPGATPTPTPGVTPTPTPTAPHTSPPYLTVNQIMATGGDKLFTLDGVKWQALSPVAGQDSFTAGSQLAFEYLATGNSYRLTRPAPAVTPTPSPAPTPIQVSFAAGSGVTTGKVTQFTTTTGSVTDTLFLIVPQQGGVDLTYTRFLSYDHDDTGTASDLHYRTVYGSLTQAGDVPTSGSATYSTTVLGNAVRSGTSYNLAGNSTGTFTVDFTATSTSTGTITTSLSLKGKETDVSPVTDFGTINGVGSILGSDFKGVLSGTSAPDAGKFGGGFFGPLAAEYGYSWYFNGTDFDAEGYASGKKNP